MNKKQQNILVAFCILIIGGLIGFGIASRHYGVGPLRNLQSIPSSATLNAGRSWAIKAGGSWSIKPIAKTPNDTASDILVTSFWIPESEDCMDYKAIKTGKTENNPDTGELFQECTL